MNRDEKKQLRSHIGDYLDVSGTRMTDDEASFLGDFIDNYEDDYKGKSETHTHTFRDWCSDGRYTREETTTHTFTDTPGIHEDYSYKDDDGQSGSSSNDITDARGILNWFRDHS